MIEWFDHEYVFLGKKRSLFLSQILDNLYFCIFFPDDLLFLSKMSANVRKLCYLKYEYDQDMNMVGLPKYLH